MWLEGVARQKFVDGESIWREGDIHKVDPSHSRSYLLDNKIFTVNNPSYIPSGVSASVRDFSANSRREGLWPFR